MLDFYYKSWNNLQRQYYEFHVNEGRGADMLPLKTTRENHYHYKYLLQRNLHHALQPYQFLRPGDHAVMAGVSDGFIELGVSTLFIMASLVGDNGHVWAVEPDERNITAIEKYIKDNAINNVTVIPNALWKRESVMEFIQFRDFTSSNMFREQFRINERDQIILWGRERREKMSFQTEVAAVSIDSIIAKGIIHNLRFANLTINGAEADGIEGAETFLEQTDVEVAFPMRDLSSPLYTILEAHGFNIAVQDGPTKAWEGRQFLYGVATRRSEEELRIMGFEPAELEMDLSEPNLFRVSMNETALDQR